MSGRYDHCLQMFNVSVSTLSRGDRASRRERLKADPTVFVHGSPSFEPGALTAQAPMLWWEEGLVMLFFAMVMGGPFVLLGALLVCAVFGSWAQLFVCAAIVVLLAFHPLPQAPDFSQRVWVAWFTRLVYCYFSYRYVWSGDAWEENLSGAPWMGAAVPHGVLPIANLLCMPAVNTATRPFVGAPASVVAFTPFLRYLLLFGYCDVSGKEMEKACKRGFAVGLVPDGIAGIFKANKVDEEVALLHRKGLARLSLRTGIPIVPAYSIGNTQAYKAWFDRWGIMESLSRRFRVSLFFPLGRFGLPIPFRANIALLYGSPIIPPVVTPNPTEEQVNELHAKLLAQITLLFDNHKAALGWGQRKLIFV